MRGYFAIGVFGCKTEANIGTLWRSANNFGAAFIFTIGGRYRRQSSDTLKTPLHIPLIEYPTIEALLESRPFNCPLIAIEQSESSRNLSEYGHPERAMYMLGAEDWGIPPKILKQCNSVVSIATPRCLNVAVAGSIVMYDRMSKAK